MSQRNKETKEQLEANLVNAMRELNIIMETTAGCGSRGQCYIDNQMRKINAIRTKLSLKTMPSPTSTDDGSYGMSSGLAALARSLG